MTIEPYRVAVSDEVLADLRARLDAARLPNEIDGAGWEQGTDLHYLRELVTYWRDEFDWRAQEARLNRCRSVRHRDRRPAHPLPAPPVRAPGRAGPCSWRTAGLVRWSSSLTSSDRSPLPPMDRLRSTWSFRRYPGTASRDPTREAGWHPRRIARAFVDLMASLGYERYGVQGGDWGSIIVANMADLAPDRVAGLHVNFLTAPRPAGERTASLTAEEQAGIEAMRHWQEWESGYSAIQGTKPQTIGYCPRGLTCRSGRMDRREVSRLERLRW